MSPPFVSGRPARTPWWLIFGAWTVLGLLFGGQGLFGHAMRGEPVQWAGILLKVCGVYTWAALTPLIFWMSRRWPLGRQGFARNLGAHLLVMLLLVPVDAGVYFLLDHAVFHAMYWNADFTAWGRFLRVLASTFGFSVFWYAGVVGISHAFDYYEALRERERRAVALERQLAQARLQVLRMQLQPHFLFNTLNTIAALVADDPRAAERMITRLSDLLRLTLEEDGRPEVPLKDEIDFLRAYLEIEQTRFQDRLSIAFHVESGVLDAQVPNLILQPLVENAIKHGIGPRSGPARIAISAARHAGNVEIRVQDDGLGLRGDRPAREGVGIGNTRARLRQLYGDAAHFALEPAPGGGAQVTLGIPYRSEGGP